MEEDPAGNRDDAPPWINSTDKLCLTCIQSDDVSPEMEVVFMWDLS